MGQRVFGLTDWTGDGALADLAARVRDGRLRPPAGTVRPLAEAPDALTGERRAPGKTVFQIADEGPA
ncbi:hypothetical protein AB0L25_31345 [Spirillospora sp. NPDC052242]